jgi:hypothetical protein
MKKKIGIILCSVFVVVWLSGCATTQQTAQKPYRMSPQGTIIYEEEFEFVPPPPVWKLLRPESGGDINFGFMRDDPGGFPSTTTFAYDEGRLAVTQGLRVEKEFQEISFQCHCEV